MNIQDTVKEIYKHINSGKKNGLENMEIMLNELKIERPEYKIIHVAGTNGKGSVSVTLEHILCAAGFVVGKFTSPHILNINERIRLDEQDISDEDFTSVYLSVKEVIERRDLTPTFFEILTAMMFLYFRDKKIDYLILEAGIGGRLDSTNIFDSDYAVITNVGYDHVEMLGDTLERIAWEKTGIIKPDSQVFVGISDPVLKDKVMERDFKRALFIGEKYRDSIYTLDFENFFTDINISGKNYRFSLFGEHQFSNFLLSYEVLKTIGLSDWVIAENCQRVKLQCRYEVVKKNPLIILDGAHNSHGIQALKRTLMKRYRPDEIVIVTSILKDKDIAEIAANLEELSEHIVLTSLAENKRGISSEVLKKYFKRRECTLEDSLVDALGKTAEIDGKITVVCGSFYLLSKFKEEYCYAWKD